VTQMQEPVGPDVRLKILTLHCVHYFNIVTRQKGGSLLTQSLIYKKDHVPSGSPFQKGIRTL
jgi:hypothetical protein